MVLVVVVLGGGLSGCFRHAARTSVPPTTASVPPSPSASAYSSVSPPVSTVPPIPAPGASPHASPGPSDAASSDAAAAVSRSASDSPRPMAAAGADRGAVRVEMKNVNLHVSEGVVLAIHSLRGALLRTVKNRPPVFDDKESSVL